MKAPFSALRAILISGITALVMAGCSGSSPTLADAGTDVGAPTITSLLTGSEATYYLDIGAAGLTGLEGFNLKNLTGGTVGLVIDQIFAADDASGNHIVPLFNFDAPETGQNTSGFTTGTVSHNAWFSEPIAATTTDIASFDAPALKSHSFLGVTMRKLSADVKGDAITLIPIISGQATTAKQNALGNLFTAGPTPPLADDGIAVADTFQTYYFDIGAANLAFAAPDQTTGDPGSQGFQGLQLEDQVDEQEGVVIEQIFAADDTSGSGASPIFTFDNPETGLNAGGFTTGTISGGTWSSGVISVDAATDPTTVSSFTCAAFTDDTDGNISPVFRYFNFIGVTMRNLSATARAHHITVVPIVNNQLDRAHQMTMGKFFTLGQTPPPPHAPIQLTDTNTTYYLDLTAAGLGNALGFHFKNLTDHPIGIEIDEIFAADDLSGTGKVTVNDFSSDTSPASVYWSTLGPSFSGAIADGVYSSGAVAPGAYFGGFATALFSKRYVGFTMRNLPNGAASLHGADIDLVPIVSSGSPVIPRQRTIGQFFLPGTTPPPFVIPYLGAVATGWNLAGVHLAGTSRGGSGAGRVDSTIAAGP